MLNIYIYIIGAWQTDLEGELDHSLQKVVKLKGTQDTAQGTYAMIPTTLDFRESPAAVPGKQGSTATAGAR